MIEIAANLGAVKPEYARLLTETLPSVIQTEEQNEAYIEQVAGLLRRESSLTPAEIQLAKLLTVLIEDFEEKAYPQPKADPKAAIRFLMDQHAMKQKDLAPVFGTASILSEVLSGKRRLNCEQIAA